MGGGSSGCPGTKVRATPKKNRWRIHLRLMRAAVTVFDADSWDAPSMPPCFEACSLRPAAPTSAWFSTTVFSTAERFRLAWHSPSGDFSWFAGVGHGENDHRIRRGILPSFVQ